MPWPKGAEDVFRCGHTKEESNRMYRADKKGCGFQCKTCKKSNHKQWRLANPTRGKEAMARVRGKAKDRLFDLQGGLCAICGKHMEHPYLDHNHKCCTVATTGCPKCRRGLLCSDCNTKLAALEKPGWIDKARLYLDKWDTFFDTTTIQGVRKIATRFRVKPV
jgi:hypothetical protein